MLEVGYENFESNRTSQTVVAVGMGLFVWVIEIFLIVWYLENRTSNWDKEANTRAAYQTVP